MGYGLPGALTIPQAYTSVPDTQIPVRLAAEEPSDNVTGTPFFQYLAIELVPLTDSYPATYTSLPEIKIAFASAVFDVSERLTAIPFFQYLAISLSVLTGFVS